ncbi:5-(carboxyamino)imidazole ribonucleotide mutase [Christensenella tenuis]|jgi:5-(carboxyamino)imidazole ribonucleotide mutase|uniref:N5-carboxyaminoimidazole ribonucleotide mutase n=1 Tax=Christensenella tenuis TaxID=2763033 RepID=A0ABR7EBF3_9FIRM|nr:5-(carboxyamino)imidazole ribonucleotide mutase [Christensenella tenuis]MBC5646988.1 5-(carboxyamino)imidazole ribonucleotide mutase [Christensenella tenuis]
MKVAVIMGSKSDLPVLKPAIDTLRDFGIEVEAHIMSAHRTPELAADFAKNAKDKGVEVIIAAAGKAAHLAGVIAGHTILPVIGLPIKSSTMDGLDSLLSTVQMPEGIPVATVAINGGKNAALLAVQILALKYDTLSDLLYKFKEDMQLKVVAADAELREELSK